MAEQNELMDKMRALATKRGLLMNELLDPARAAANAMADAGMSRTADALSQKIFEIDAMDSEIRDLLKQDPEAFLGKLAELMDRYYGK